MSEEDLFNLQKHLESPRILIVEDMGALAEVMGDILENSGAQVKIVGNGQDGFNAATSYNPDIIITDQKLPIKRGDEMVKELKEKGFAKPVIMLSGFDNEEAVANALRCGVYNFLSKPVSKDILMAVLQNALKMEATRVRQEATIEALTEKAGATAESLESDISERIDKMRKQPPTTIS